MSADTTKSDIQIPTRQEIPIDYTWDLKPLFANDEEWESCLSEYASKLPELNSTKGKVGLSPRDLRDVLELEKTLAMSAEKLGQYAGLRLAEDSSNDANLSRQARLDSLITQAGELSAHIRPEIMAIDDSKWAAFLEAPELCDWVEYLKKIRRFRPHVLTASEERLVALAGEPLGGFERAFSQLMNVDMRFGSTFDEEGKEQPLTQSTLSSFLLARKPEVRRRAFHQFYREVSEHGHTLASLYAHSVKTDVFSARARNYTSSLNSALFPDSVPVDVYENLIVEVRAGLPALQDYYELRRQVLGLEKLHHYDTYVPLVSEIKRITPYEEAVKLVVDALRPLGAEYCQILERGLINDRWVDRYETKGKRSGAFSWGSYGSPPYIMMNYKDDVFGDVYTLAHEAGHSMHTWYSHRSRNWQDAHYTIFAAEVASTFNEELLTHHLLAQTDDLAMRAYILCRQIDDIRSTLFRQTMFAEFERTTHAMQEAGEALTYGSIRSVYRKLLDVYLAPAVCVDEELELECLRIPHFYSAFYVYKYATGISAAIALSDRVLSGGESERLQYLEFLKLGGLRYPLDALRVAGVDMSRPEPVRAAIELFRRRVDELRELLG